MINFISGISMIVGTRLVYTSTVKAQEISSQELTKTKTNKTENVARPFFIGGALAIASWVYSRNLQPDDLTFSAGSTAALISTNVLDAITEARKTHNRSITSIVLGLLTSLGLAAQLTKKIVPISRELFNLTDTVKHVETVAKLSGCSYITSFLKGTSRFYGMALTAYTTKDMLNAVLQSAGRALGVSTEPLGVAFRRCLETLPSFTATVAAQDLIPEVFVNALAPFIPLQFSGQLDAKTIIKYSLIAPAVAKGVYHAGSILYYQIPKNKEKISENAIHLINDALLMGAQWLPGYFQMQHLAITELVSVGEGLIVGNEC
jgi:hypothetical protein